MEKKIPRHVHNISRNRDQILGNCGIVPGNGRKATREQGNGIAFLSIKCLGLRWENVEE